jgi:hypothetical protein
MSLLELSFSIYLVVILLICFVNIRIGISMFLFYSILVPYLQLFSFGQNFFYSLILVALIYKYGYKKLIYRPLIPFIFLYMAQFFIIPFHLDLPILEQLNLFRIDFMSTLLLPFAMINVMNNDQKAVSLFSKTLIATIIVAVGYSLLLTRFYGFNPYIFLIQPLSGKEFNESYALAFGEGRLFGRISGVFTHPMTNGIFLSFSLLFVLDKIDFNKIIKNTHKILFSFILIFTLSVIGVRTAIGAVGASILFFILLERKFKVFMISLVGAIILIFVLIQIPGTEQYINSIFDPMSSSVNGSSFEMREKQIESCLNEIKDNFIFGNGYGWTVYYRLNVGKHPTMLSFESLIIVILADNGFVGLGIWLTMVLIYIRNISFFFNNKEKHIMFALFFTYITYSIITGEYGYMKYFLVFYSIIWYGNYNFVLFKDNLKNAKESKSYSILSTPVSPNT